MSLAEEEEGVVQSPSEEELDLRHGVGHYENLLSGSKCCYVSNSKHQFISKVVKNVLNCCLVVISPSQSAVSVWLIKWGTLSSSVLSLLSPSLVLPVLGFVAKTRSPAACCAYFWGMWSLERRSRTSASLRWRETPERCGQWEGPWGGTRWVWLTVIDRLLSYLLYLVRLMEINGSYEILMTDASYCACCVCKH